VTFETDRERDLWTKTYISVVSGCTKANLEGFSPGSITQLATRVADDAVEAYRCRVEGE